MIKDTNEKFHKIQHALNWEEGSDVQRLENLKEHELRIVWNILWEGTQGQFTRKCAINQGNFSRWLNGKANSTASVKAVQEFIQNEFNLKPPVNNMNYDAIFTEITNRIEKLTELKGLIWVDGDNIIQVLHDLDQMAPEGNGDDWPFHVIVGLVRNLNCTATQLVHGRSWISLLRTETNISNATDFVITMSMATFNITVSHKIPFYLITSDHFHIEVIPWLKRHNPRREFVVASSLSLEFVANSLSKLSIGQNDSHKLK